MFQQGEDQIECINKAMEFLSALASSNEKGIGMNRTQPKRQGIYMVKGEIELDPEVPLNRNAKLTAFQQEIDTLKETLSNHGKKRNLLIKTLTDFKTKSKEKESKYIDKEIVLEKQNKELENIIFLKDTFNAFDKTLLDEITKVQTVFNQMEAVLIVICNKVTLFEIQIKQLSIDNDQLLKQIMSQEIMHIAVNSVDILDVKKSCVNECNKCLELETELLKKKDLIEMMFT
ncbi:hypothetical protein Tco_1063101 [Tanacetum coccineum]